MRHERAAIVSLIRPLADRMAHLSLDSRLTLLCSLLTQEICTLPAGIQSEALQQIVAQLPDILSATEAGMRQALVENARREL